MKYLKLSSIMEYPDQDELIWNFIGEMDFNHTEFEVCEINVAEWYSLIKESFEQNAEPWQKKMVKDLRKNIIKTKKKILVIDKEEKNLVDGYHHLVALALEKVESIKAINLSKEK